MMGRTHAMIGVASLGAFSLISGYFSSETFALLAVAAAFGALLPDLDAAESQIKHLQVMGLKPLTPLSRIIHRALGHRGLLHSLLGVCLASLVVMPLGVWWDWSLPITVSLGYASHLAADACTKSGIPILFPRRRRYYLVPRTWRLTTGSPAEEMLFVVVTLLVLALLLRQWQLSPTLSFT